MKNVKILEDISKEEDTSSSSIDDEIFDYRSFSIV